MQKKPTRYRIQQQTYEDGSIRYKAQHRFIVKSSFTPDEWSNWTDLGNPSYTERGARYAINAQKAKTVTRTTTVWEE